LATRLLRDQQPHQLVLVGFENFFPSSETFLLSVPFLLMNNKRDRRKLQ
jgi:hypothetical protein